MICWTQHEKVLTLKWWPVLTSYGVGRVRESWSQVIFLKLSTMLSMGQNQTKMDAYKHHPGVALSLMLLLKRCTGGSAVYTWSKTYGHRYPCPVTPAQNKAEN